MVKEQNKREKPIFKGKSSVIRVNDIDGTNLNFSPHRRKFISHYSSIQREGVSMPSFGQLIPLIYSALEHQGNVFANYIVTTLRYHQLTGKTSALMAGEGVYFDDTLLLPTTVNIPDYENALRSSLGKKEENGVIYSNDGNIRFIPYDKFTQGNQSPSDLEKNQGLVALVNGRERAELVAKASENWALAPYFGGFERENEPYINFPFIYSGDFDGRLRISGLPFSFDPCYFEMLDKKDLITRIKDKLKTS